MLEPYSPRRSFFGEDIDNCEFAWLVATTNDQERNHKIEGIAVKLASQIDADSVLIRHYDHNTLRELDMDGVDWRYITQYHITVFVKYRKTQQWAQGDVFVERHKYGSWDILSDYARHRFDKEVKGIEIFPWPSLTSSSTRRRLGEEKLCRIAAANGIVWRRQPVPCLENSNKTWHLNIKWHESLVDAVKRGEKEWNAQVEKKRLERITNTDLQIHAVLLKLWLAADLARRSDIEPRNHGYWSENSQNNEAAQDLNQEASDKLSRILDQLSIDGSILFYPPLHEDAPIDVLAERNILLARLPLEHQAAYEKDLDEKRRGVAAWTAYLEQEGTNHARKLTRRLRDAGKEGSLSGEASDITSLVEDDEDVEPASFAETGNAGSPYKVEQPSASLGAVDQIIGNDDGWQEVKKKQPGKPNREVNWSDRNQTDPPSRTNGRRSGRSKRSV